MVTTRRVAGSDVSGQGEHQPQRPHPGAPGRRCPRPPRRKRQSAPRLHGLLSPSHSRLSARLPASWRRAAVAPPPLHAHAHASLQWRGAAAMALAATRTRQRLPASACRHLTCQPSPLAARCLPHAQVTLEELSMLLLQQVVGACLSLLSLPAPVCVLVWVCGCACSSGRARLGLGLLLTQASEPCGGNDQCAQVPTPGMKVLGQKRTR